MNANWSVIDASNQSFGRLATRLAVTLQGKDTPAYQAHLLQAPRLVIINCRRLNVPLRRHESSKYRHSGHLGNLKEEKFGSRPNSERLRDAVRLMLPKNKLSKAAIKRLHCFEDDQHPFKAQIK